MLKLSIIIPCYNCEQTLSEAINSCYHQGFLENEFEIILVDDKSTDGTPTLIKKLAPEHPNIQYFFHEINHGGGAARNTAVSHSKGEVIFGLDSDDILPSKTLLNMYSYLKEKNCDGVTIHKSIKFSGENIQNIDHVDVSPFIDMRIPVTSLLSKKREFHPILVTFMYTRKAFDKIGGYPTGHGYDTQGFGWRFLCAGLTVYTCPDAEYLHRIHFNESYFVREYNNGKINYNWQDILVEHYYIFTDKTLKFILEFNCKDFTRNILDELIDRNDTFLPNVESVLGKVYPPLSLDRTKRLYVPRNSIQGYAMRIRHRLRSLLRRPGLSKI